MACHISPGPRALRHALWHVFSCAESRRAVKRSQENHKLRSLTRPGNLFCLPPYFSACGRWARTSAVAWLRELVDRLTATAFPNACVRWPKAWQKYREPDDSTTPNHHSQNRKTSQKRNASPGPKKRLTLKKKGKSKRCKSFTKIPQTSRFHYGTTANHHRQNKNDPKTHQASRAQPGRSQAAFTARSQAKSAALSPAAFFISRLRLTGHPSGQSKVSNILVSKYDHIPFLGRLASAPASNLISLVAFFKSCLNAARAARKAGKLSGGCSRGTAGSVMSTTWPASAAESAILRVLRQQLRCLKAKEEFALYHLIGLVSLAVCNGAVCLWPLLRQYPSLRHPVLYLMGVASACAMASTRRKESS